MKVDISISIVSYNTKDLLERCLSSIYKYTKKLKFEIIVVDNASEDDSASVVRKKFPHVKLIANKKNNFFSDANNQALKIAKGKYFLILNSDTYFTDNSIKTALDYLEKNDNVGAIDGLEIYDNGKFVETGSRFSTPLIDFYELSFIGKRFKNESVIKNYRISNKKRDQDFPIDVGCDAFLFVRTDIMNKIKGYDTKFFLYYTENDLCLRIKKLGFEVMHLGNVRVMHSVSASVKKIGWKKLDIYYKDLLQYYRKNGYVLEGTALYSLLKLEEVALKIFRPQTVR